MKKKLLMLLLLYLFLLTGCENDYSANTVNDIDFTASTLPPTATAFVTPTASVSELLKESEIALPIDVLKYPKLDEELTKELTTYVYESFGGSGLETYAASWYKYIDYWEVFQDENSYSCVLHLQESPFDISAQLLSKYYSEDEFSILCPILLDTCASLDLDVIDLCLIGELLYKIRTYENTEIYYNALAALDIPIYDFLASGFGRKVSDVKLAIEKNQMPSDKAYDCIVDHMAYTYEGAFDGLSMEKVKYISYTVLANFNSVEIEAITVVDNENNYINTYEN